MHHAEMVRILLLGLVALLVLVARREPRVEVALPCYEPARGEIVRKLRLHQAHLLTLKGDETFDSYRANFLHRSSQIIERIETKEVRFYLYDNEASIMKVTRHFTGLKDGIFVNKKYLGRFQKPSVYAEHVICHELSHLVFWSEDTDPAKIRQVPIAALPEHADWFNFVILFSGNQKHLESFYLTK